MTASTKCSKVRAILFDMDGTLINSEEIYINQLNNILSTNFNKGPLSEPVKQKIQGRPGIKISEIIVQENQLTGKCTAAEFYELTNDPKQLALLQECQFLPGIQDFLIHVKRKYDLPIAIATSTTRTKFTAKTQHLQENGFDLFDVTVTGGGNPKLPKEKGKPQPDIWFLALDELNEKLGLKDTKDEIKMTECMIFEDSVSGIQSAINANAKSVWIPSHSFLLNSLLEKELLYYKENCEVILDSFLQFKKENYGWL